MIVCYLLLTLIWSIVYIQAELQPKCDIHKNNPGKHTPSSILPSKADRLWLYEEVSEIEKWVLKAKIDCPRHLTAAENELKSGHASFFTDPNNIPMITQCRGRNTYFDYTGTILVPFGPYSECPTYSKCWFGLMSCGSPKEGKIKDSMVDFLTKAMVTASIPGAIPAYTQWSVRALHMLVRVVGAEIVVPELKYLSLSTGEDVLIGQYVLTRPLEAAQLEMRLFELYPSILMNWTNSQISDYGMQNLRSMHLGGSEGRCRPWTKCSYSNTCCGCDEKSFVTGTPAKVSVPDGSEKCPEVRAQALPLCKNRDSSQPGRWVASALQQFSPHCDASAHNTIFHQDLRSLPDQMHPSDSVSHIDFNLSAHQYGSASWFEASGDPCLVNGKEAEDLGETHWFYAPYTCKYHFYNRMELHKCLLDQKLTHIHVAGDSMSRDLFAFLSLYLGVPQVQEAELKHLTNTLMQNNVRYHSGRVLLSEGYSWDYNPGVMRLSEQAPLPNIYITNYGLAHRNWNFPIFQQKWNETEYQYWTKERPQSVPLPQFRFFQSAKDMTGRRNIGWSANVFRQDSAYLERNYTAMGFGILDEFLFTTGRYEFHIPSADGWHFAGTKRQMEVVALFNMVCNDWLSQHLHA